MNVSEPLISPGCESARRELNAYVDGELPPAERAAVQRHLDGCDGCRAEIELLRLVSQSLRRVARPEPSQAMRQRLLARVAAEPPPRRTEILCVERQGERVIQRQAVQMSREPAVSGRLPPVPGPARLERAPGPIIQQFRRVLSDHPKCIQIIESYERRNYHERRA